MIPSTKNPLLNIWRLQKMFPQQWRDAIKRCLGPKVVNRIRRFRSERERRKLIKIERRHGTEAAHIALWQNPTLRRSWSAVLDHLSVLVEDHPEHLDNFIETGIRECSDSLILINLSQHPLTARSVGRILQAERMEPWPVIDERMATRADYAAAFLVATAMTGDDEALDHARSRIPDIINETFLQVIESFGQRPADTNSDIDPILRGLKRNGLRSRQRHRLVIAENFQNRDAFVPLLCKADKITLVGLDDTFGKTSFNIYKSFPNIGEIVVEHIRSRITRFSTKYIEAHSLTRDTAIELAAIVDSVPGLVPEGNLPHIELAISDYLFFKLLRLRAVEELLADSEFDHIVVVFNSHSPSSDYISMLAGVDGLTTDPRVELISLAQTVSQRSSFSTLLSAILTGPRPSHTSPFWLPPKTELAAQLKRNAQIMSSSLPDRAVPEQDEKTSSVMVVATCSSSYDFSTARYAAALSHDFATALTVCGGSGDSIQSRLTEIDVPDGLIPFQLLSRNYLPKKTSFAFERWFAGQINLLYKARSLHDKVAHIIACAPKRLVTTTLSQLMHGHVLDAWFARMGETGGLPSAIVLSTPRMPSVTQFTAIARRYGVPTLTLEAHALNANYCRYSKVNADYYGVMAEQFRADAATSFAISRERIQVIGTPRIIAVPARSHNSARADIANDWNRDFPMRSGGVISFFSQPSNWQYVAQIWEMILVAAKDLDLQVLLKPHPEETHSRINQYDAIARRIKAEDQVQLTMTDPNTIIEASDVVLTTYSTVALDAAVLGRPVICVAVGAADYPLNLHKIAHAPLVRDLDSLTHELQIRLADPDAASKAHTEFLALEPQFAEGPDTRLRHFMAEILAAPVIRSSKDLPEHLFLDPPHPTFVV